MNQTPIRTTVVGSYPFPGWLEFASQNLDKFGAADIEEMIEDAVIAAIHDQARYFIVHLVQFAAQVVPGQTPDQVL